MNILIDGKFNPKCVQVGNDGKPWLWYDGSVEGLNVVAGRRAADMTVEQLRKFAKWIAESALGRSLEDYSEPEQPVYGIATWTVGIVSGQLHRECGGIVEEWRDNRWYASGADKGWFRKHTAPLTTEQVEKLFGRAALGLPVEEETGTGMWISDDLHRDNNGTIEYWHTCEQQWKACCSPEYDARGTKPTLTCAQVIEKYGEEPLE